METKYPGWGSNFPGSSKRHCFEEPSCVGWNWFRYSDNDPGDKSVDPSNRDSNKGIVNNRYEPYAPLLDSMKRINSRLYVLAEHFAKARHIKPRKTSGEESVTKLTRLVRQELIS